MVASITTLGAGSNLQLQDILDKLRTADEKAVLTPKKDSITKYNSQLEEFTVVNNKLLSMKGKALALSLSSNFLGRAVTSSNQNVLTATVSDGATVQKAAITVSRIASKSSWMTGGVSSTGSSVYVPTSQESTAGVANPATDVVAKAGETLTITYGGTKTLALNIGADRTMNDLVNDINTLAANQGGGGANGRYVTAETFVSGGKSYLRIKSDTAGATGEAHRVALNETLASLDFSAPAKTFSYKIGTKTASVSVAADTTLDGLVALINADTNNPGATASTVNDGGANPYRLVLQANATGEDNRITMLTQLPDITLAEQQGAGASSLNAQFSVDGISYQRQSNTFSDVFSGVSVTLLGAGSSSLEVAGNNDQIKKMVTDLVTAYNDVVQEVQKNTAWDKNAGKFGVLASTTLRDLPSDLQNLMTSTVNADAQGKVTTLFSLGLNFNRDGTISIDQATLDDAIANNGEGVKKFFLGNSATGITGFADLVNDRLRVITGGTGQIAAEQNAAETSISALEDQITKSTDRLERKYAVLTTQFIQLDSFMSQMTSVSKYLTSQFASLSGTDTKNQG